MSTHLAFLRIPLYMLTRLKSVDDFTGFSADEITRLQDQYTPEELQEIRQALAFAAENPDFDFGSLVEGTPFSNAAIYAFLGKVRQSIDDGLGEL